MLYNLVKLLKEAKDQKMLITAAESCTGGLLMAELTNIPGSSAVIDRGFITYSNQSKIEMLGVRESTLTKHGAVSRETAEEMATGAIKHSLANFAISITGIAGPGASSGKPESDAKLNCSSEAVDFGPIGRTSVRKKAVMHGLVIIKNALHI
ncbi:MAG: CinA family protein [Proteobacteria bacterium]|nr:CinA family protein [Pseudomonadota bacterium]